MFWKEQNRGTEKQNSRGITPSSGVESAKLVVVLSTSISEVSHCPQLRDQTNNSRMLSPDISTGGNANPSTFSWEDQGLGRFVPACDNWKF
jgi:hypothetical protein